MACEFDDDYFPSLETVIRGNFRTIHGKNRTGKSNAQETDTTPSYRARDLRSTRGHRSDFEVFSIAEFRKRVTAEHLRAPQRVDFHVLIYVTAGRCTHSVDFKRIHCEPGSLLIVHPGQVQQYEARATHWQGWMGLFLPEFLHSGAPARESVPKAFGEPMDLPVHSVLNAKRSKRP